MVTQLFDGFHLFIQVVSLNEVTQLKGRQESLNVGLNTAYPAEAASEILPILSREKMQNNDFKAAKDTREEAAFSFASAMPEQDQSEARLLQNCSTTSAHEVPPLFLTTSSNRHISEHI